MARFTVRLETSLPAPVAWERVLDVARHADIVPFTTIEPYAVQLVPGARFVARTAWGPVGVDDVMVVDEVTPPTESMPGQARIRKEGKVIRGWVEVTAVPHAEGGSTLQWVQEIAVRGVPRALGPVVALCGRAAYRWALRRMLARP